ncbi:hypothetical protein LTR10_023409 [Elasticomyces elasticus]|uniref:Uncharacterized protein n=1 Tax=Exophiala sideris TaxID=1016849 RepID=A0ABR0JJR7_9EURO|nr:hypothetical protein LTR10_023409 [Elasticomyces elasticus]KAK5035304.1 hypothetical protein LTS07_002740 [Exophiala sideris]KAK5039345.1 hypothetical protein LTR13_003602 [Exophiala sideris]KAK5066228.1 hypothetical protein LTR69_002746 [Exophiala sideris]KAK5186905.1 hypothetical protein LTR44_000911 [Eurotiomycetes sp. CCFEE 6388]
MARVKAKTGRLAQKSARKGRRKPRRQQTVTTSQPALTTAQKLDLPLQAQPPQGRLPQPLASKEREAMYESLMYFMNNDKEKKEEILRLFQSEQKGLMLKYLQNDMIQAEDLSDVVVRGISQIIYERDPAKDVDIQVPQEHITEEMQAFNDAWVDLLPEVQLDQLQGSISYSVPSLKRMAGKWLKKLPPSKLPENQQIAVNKFLHKHLPDDVKRAIEQGELEPKPAGRQDLKMDYGTSWMFDWSEERGEN